MFKNEFLKNFRWKASAITVIILVIINVFHISIAETNSDEDWKQYAGEMRQSYNEALEECERENMDESICDTFTEQIALIDYSIEHGIPYGAMNVWKHMVRMTEMFEVLLLLLLFVFGSVFIKEYESHTWKNLLLTGVGRNRLFFTKWIFGYIWGLMIAGVHLAVSFLCGTAAFGINARVISPELADGVVVEQNLCMQIFKLYGMFAIKTLFYSAFTTMCVVFLEGRMMAVLIPCVLALSTHFIATAISGSPFSEVLPFSYLALSDIQGIREWTKMMAAVGIYSAGMLLLAKRRFNKSDLI